MNNRQGKICRDTDVRIFDCLWQLVDCSAYASCFQIADLCSVDHLAVVIKHYHEFPFAETAVCVIMSLAVE